MGHIWEPDGTTAGEGWLEARCEHTNPCPEPGPPGGASLPLTHAHVRQAMPSLDSGVLGFPPYVCRAQRRQAPQPSRSALDPAPSSF